MKRLGGGALALLVWAAALVLPAVALPTVACAAEGPRAALVVDTGDSVHRFCVALPDDRVSGLELITLAGEQHGLSYRFGYGGAAVCMLADVGTTADDCFERYPDFWGYWRGGEGGWTWSSTGAGDTTVRDGDVEGWSWGSGSDGSSHPRPPETSFGSVCPVAAEPAKPPERSSGAGRKRRPRTSQDPPAAAPPGSVPARAGARENPDASTADDGPRRKRSRHKVARSKPVRRKDPRPRIAAQGPPVSPTPDAVLASRTAPEPDTSMPAGGFAALGLATALGVGGLVFARRRRGPS